MAEFDNYANEYNQLLDDSIGLSGENFEYFANYKAQYLIKRVVEKRTCKILDFGCGVGNLSQALAHLMPEAIIHGYDPSLKSLENIPESLFLRGHFTDDMETLDEDFDVVFLSGVLHHIDPVDRAEILVDIAARMVPGGTLVIFEHNPANPVTRRIVDASPLDENAILLPPSEAEELLNEAKLISIRKDYIVFFPHVLSLLRPFEKYLGWFPLGAQYAISGRKNISHYGSRS